MIMILMDLKLFDDITELVLVLCLNYSGKEILFKLNKEVNPYSTGTSL